MAYVNLSNEQAAKLANTLGPEFTAVAKNELLNFADAILGFAETPIEVPEVKTFVAEPKAKTPAKDRSV